MNMPLWAILFAYVRSTSYRSHLVVATCLAPFMVSYGISMPAASGTKEPDYARDVRPILARNCLACHGADDAKRQAGLRLDTRAGAVLKLSSGIPAILPGNAKKSAILTRIASQSDALHMPPKETGHSVSPEEVKVLASWINAGAPYANHWSFSKPKPISLPTDTQNIIDPFIRQGLITQGLRFAAPADRRTFLRRVSLDLIGLPPTLEAVTAFERDRQTGFKERAVDRLLASKHFGEKWARPWMDLARYADSAGYGSDPLRSNLWPWRDWVINALNENVPYDVFVTTQLAGDLMPNATVDQRTATGFHRNTMTNTEGGTSDEEFRTAAVKDRLQTTLQGVMGLTVQCAQCHTHKFDPITQREYYQLLAFFNQSEDNDQPDDTPTLSVLPISRRQKIADMRVELAAIETRFKGKPPQVVPGVKTVRITILGTSTFLMLAEVEVYAAGKNIAKGLPAKQSSTDFEGLAHLAVDGNTDGNFAKKSTTHTARENNPWWEVELTAPQSIDSITLYTRTDAHVGMTKNVLVTYYDENRKVIASTTLADAVVGPRNVMPFTDPESIRYEHLKGQLALLKPLDVPIMVELPTPKRRVSTMLTLGNFQMKGEAVSEGTPRAFGMLPKNAVANRLTLAKWMFNTSNPLTARVAVNRIWAQLFGRGIVETEEDFGMQGSLPSNQPLLDQLSVAFAYDWNVKELIREIVLSETYAQSSIAMPRAERIDPRNIYLSHYPRRRLDAETVRDQTLKLSGLLTPTIGGPSVYPPQPDGLWQAAFNGERTYPTSVGPDRYRRGLYTFWRRTVPYPSMATFDAPSREACTLRRQPTNTPLQALVTLNDPVYIEMAQAYAIRILRAGKGSDRARAAWAIENATLQKAKPAQVDAIIRLVNAERIRLTADKKSAEALGNPKSNPVPKELDLTDVAVWTVVSNVVLNLDHVLTLN